MTTDYPFSNGQQEGGDKALFRRSSLNENKENYGIMAEERGRTQTMNIITRICSKTPVNLKQIS